MIPYLQLDNITKRWGEVNLFEGLSFTISQGEKVALIAKNGTGKTTLMNIINGDDLSDDGKVILNHHIRVGYLRQQPRLNPDQTVMEATFSAEGERVRAVVAYEEALESHDHKRIEESMDELTRLNCWDLELKIKQILTELKITNLHQPIRELSGGQKKRVALAHLLIDEPDFLILDEPTNHLDLEMIEWLEKTLEKSKCTLLMVTHDRYFLDRVCNEIIELDDRTFYRYKGNYSYYVEKRAERIQAQTAEIDRAKNLFRTELEWLRRMPQARGHKSKYRTENAYLLKEKASRKMGEESLELSVRSQRLGNKIIDVANLRKAFGNTLLLDNFTYKFARMEKIGIVGKNGTGKSTFLNLITGVLPADNGTIAVGETIRFGYFRQDELQFDPLSRVIDVVKDIAEVIDMGNGSHLTASQFLNHFLFPPEAQYTQIGKLSGGEKRRLYLCTILMQNPNFLILDEPTNDLDIMTLNVLEEYLRSFTGCLIVVSHDRFFMDKIVDHLFVFKGNGIIRNFPGNYSDYREWQEEQDRIEKASLPTITKSEKQEKNPAIADRKKMSFKEKQEYQELEKMIPVLESEKQEIETTMNSGNASSDELFRLSVRHKELSGLLDEKEMRWLELSELL